VPSIGNFLCIRQCGERLKVADVQAEHEHTHSHSPKRYQDGDIEQQLRLQQPELQYQSLDMLAEADSSSLIDNGPTEP